MSNLELESQVCETYKF